MCLARLKSPPGGLGRAGAGGIAPSPPAAAAFQTPPGSPSRGSVSGKLPPVGLGTTQCQKLASFDWPPPPSPAAAVRGGMGATARGAFAKGLGATSPHEKEADLRAAELRSVEINARAELWAIRADIEREKLRNVAPYPFFGFAMRFQDEFAALQIMEDGRFCYSTLSLENLDAHDEDSGSGSSLRQERRRVVTYEGVFASPSALSMRDANNPNDPRNAERLAAPLNSDPEVASIEGHAMVRHETEEHQGRTRFIAVDRGSYRFAITVSPFYQPSEATVFPLAKPRTPGRQRPRCKQLPYVGVGGPFYSGNQYRRDVKLPHRRRASRMLKGSGHTRSAAALPPVRSQEQMESAVQWPEVGNSPPRTKLGTSASAPQLVPLPGKDNNSNDWKDFYQKRADLMMNPRG